MRKVMMSLLIVVLATALMASAVSAGGNPPPPLSSGFQLQNRSTLLAATVSIEFFDQNGVSVKTMSDTIAAKAAKSYYVPSLTGLPDSGRFSVVVGSTEELFALVNEVTASGSTPYVAATHSGLSSEDAGSPIYFPWVVCGYYDYNSMFAVQNAGAADTTVTIEFYQSGQSTPKKTYTFNNTHAGQSVYLDMTADPYKTDLCASAAFFGAVKAFSTGNSTPLAGALNDTNPAGGFLRSYNAVKSAGTKLYAPQVTSKYYGYSSGITMQNPDAVNTANVTVQFFPTGSTTAAATLNTTVAPGSAKAVYLPSVTGMPNNFNGTAVINSTNGVPIMGIANHDHDPAGPAASYNLILDSDAATTVYMPQIVRAYYGFEAGYMLFNTGPGDVAVNVEFTKPDGSVVANITHNIPAGTAIAVYLGGATGAPLGVNFNGGAKATVTSGNGKLVGIANFVAPNVGDNMQVYNQFK